MVCGARGRCAARSAARWPRDSIRRAGGDATRWARPIAGTAPLSQLGARRGDEPGQRRDGGCAPRRWQSACEGGGARAAHVTPRLPRLRRVSGADHDRGLLPHAGMAARGLRACAGRLGASGAGARGWAGGGAAVRWRGLLGRASARRGGRGRRSRRHAALADALTHGLATVSGARRARTRAARRGGPLARGAAGTDAGPRAL